MRFRYYCYNVPSETGGSERGAPLGAEGRGKEIAFLLRKDMKYPIHNINSLYPLADPTIR